MNAAGAATPGPESTGAVPSVAQRVAAAAGAVTLAAMIATPLARRGGSVRRGLSSVVVTGLFVTTAAGSTRRWGVRRAAGVAAGVAAATAVAERVGTATGLPFGRYYYTDALRPQVGGVPVIVPLAWFAMAVPARDAAHAALGHRSRRVTRIALGAGALTAWDLFLDPQMVGEGYWRWARRGRYRGIPFSNYVGWLLVSAGVMAALEVALPIDDGEAADAVSVAQYATMATMETVGFAAFFRDRVVAAVGGAAMLPIAAAAVRQAVRRRRWARG
jgi:putative membrane protein